MGNGGSKIENYSSEELATLVYAFERVNPVYRTVAFMILECDVCGADLRNYDVVNLMLVEMLPDNMDERSWLLSQWQRAKINERDFPERYRER
jgi:hypothetical protein